MIITRTGWPFDYIDDLCLCRAIELLEYWRREIKWQSDAMKKASSGKTPSQIDVPEFVELDENAAMWQFNQIPRANGQQLGMENSIERMPQEFKDMIQFAEDFKSGKNKPKLN